MDTSLFKFVTAGIRVSIVTLPFTLHFVNQTTPKFLAMIVICRAKDYVINIYLTNENIIVMFLCE
jgi:hypothetical protein